MKKIVIGAFLLISSVSFAQSRNVKSIGNDQNKTIECNNNIVFITGNNNVLNITGNCKEIKVIGSDNVIKVNKVDEIYINGSTNSFTYKSSLTPDKKVGSEIIGSDNKVAQK